MKEKKSIIPNPVVITPLIADLRRGGLKVRVSIERPYVYLVHGKLKQIFLTKREAKIVGNFISANQYSLNNNGGVVKVTVRGLDGNESHGEAHCSKTEAFNHKYGVTLALGRALIQAGYSIAGLSYPIDKKVE